MCNEKFHERKRENRNVIKCIDFLSFFFLLYRSVLTLPSNGSWKCNLLKTRLILFIYWKTMNKERKYISEMCTICGASCCCNFQKNFSALQFFLYFLSMKNVLLLYCWNVFVRSNLQKNTTQYIFNYIFN